MRIKSFAKINLGLEVIGKRGDGYHEVRTLLQAVDLYDVLEFRSAPEGRVNLEGDDPTVSWGEDNLIFRAALLLKKSQHAMHGIRGRRIAMIFQDPTASLNPVFSIGNQMTRVIRQHLPLGRDEASASRRK